MKASAASIERRFCFDVWPAISVMRFLGTSKSSESSSRSFWLALPSMGGAASLSVSTLFCQEMY